MSKGRQLAKHAHGPRFSLWHCKHPTVIKKIGLGWEKSESVKYLANIHKDLSSVPRTHVVEEKTSSQKSSSDLHKYVMAQYMYMYSIHILNKCNFLNLRLADGPLIKVLAAKNLMPRTCQAVF